ncbi:inosine 5'-monophosphate dehydrogenase [Posidoniimonas polymericola]|uniref:Inosine 5'-monophosphate dehydrogenase n=1 Tax=Posidoniimonas polymericola TaxID=2528002 RepID=A0A5C5YGM8_9BACT|nr:CBS domain-containing protein [Posidoniimonas polymericola]TWT74550.1 inosine 5'-monophosphate dehydrogenase [Posidoniimonas polymericola]
MKVLAQKVDRLTVADVMSSLVITLDETANMRDAARRLREADVSGAPVVDSTGVVVGVLSAMDFVEQATGATGDRCPITEVLVRDTPTGPYRIEQVCEDSVANHMTRYVQTVDRDASLRAASREMCLARLHRLIVVDDRGRPVGVISPLDLLAAWVDAPAVAPERSAKGAPK